MSEGVSKYYPPNVFELSWPKTYEFDVESENAGSLSLIDSSQDLTRNAKEAERDFADASFLVGARIRSFIESPGGRERLATSLDGMTNAKRSEAQSRDIFHLIDDVASSNDDVPAFGDDVFQLPETVISSTADPFEISNSVGKSLLPEGVSLAYVSRGLRGDDQIFVDGAIGFREMHVAARFGYAMAIGHEARKRGVEVLEGPIAVRIAAALDGTHISTADTPELFFVGALPVVTVSSGDFLYVIEPSDYVETAALENWAADS